MDEKPNSEDLETDNVYLAAFLSLRAEYAGRRKQGTRVLFGFRGSDLAELREEFFGGKALVDPCRYAAQIGSFKRLCF